MNKQEIILASSSPRRIEIMKKNGINPIIMPANIDETIPKKSQMEDAVMYLALKKALYIESKISKQVNSAPIIMAADTIVYKDKIIGKPKDKDDAYNILWSLKGNNHYVATGVCILQTGKPIRHCFCEITKVFFKDYTKQELDEYLNTPEPYDKAGAYAIQGTFGKYVEHIEGDLNNVIGFPWDRIKKEYNNLFNK